MPNAEPRLPARLSLEQLRKQAKNLLRAYRAGEESAQKRAAEGTPHAAVRSFSLADAQFVIAREAGFESWTRLKRHVKESWRYRFVLCERFAVDLARPSTPTTLRRWRAWSGDYASLLSAVLAEASRKTGFTRSRSGSVISSGHLAAIARNEAAAGLRMPRRVSRVSCTIVAKERVIGWLEREQTWERPS